MLSARTNSQRAQIVRHFGELPDHLGVSEIADGWVAAAANSEATKPGLRESAWLASRRRSAKSTRRLHRPFRRRNTRAPWPKTFIRQVLRAA